MSNPSKILDIYGIVPDSIVDGPGLRYSIFVQGCSHNCPGCHNPESHAYGCGQKRTVDELLAEIENNKLVEGVTLSGGEPFDQAEASAELARALKAQGYSVWAYSGYLFDKLVTDPERRALLETIDVLVDGPFVQSLQSYELDWRGSSNQRIIDVPKSLAAGEVVLWEKPSTAEYPIPENW